MLSDAVLSPAASLLTENTSLTQQAEGIGLGWFLALSFVSGTELEAARYAGVCSSCVRLGCCSVAGLEGRCSPPRAAGEQRAASCGLRGHGAGSCHRSGAGNGEGVTFSKGFTLSRGCKV